MSDNLSSFFEGALPGVYISKIVLNVANEKWTSPFNKNPHIQRNALEPNWIEEAEESTASSEESLDVFVNFSLKAKVPKGRDLMTSWLFNQDFLGFYNIRVVSVESETVYEGIHASNDRIIELVEKKLPKTEAKTITLSDSGLFKLTDEEDIKEYIKDFHKTIDSDGNIIYDIPFSHTIKVKNVNPDHLSLFVIPYLDVDKIKKDFGITQDTEIDFMLGTHIDEPIIREGKLVTEKTIYRQNPTGDEIASFIPSSGNPVAKGKIWHGPVHYHGAAQTGDKTGYIGWMAGTSHDPSQNQPKLSEERVYNRTIQDFRTLKRIEKQVFDFSQIENKKLGQGVISYPINDNLDVSRSPSYFSELFTSRDHEGKCRFFFSVDYLTMIKKNSAFPILFENSDPAIIEELLRKSYIRSFKLFRNRISTTASGLNKLGTKTSVEFDQEIPPQLLVSTRDNVITAGSGPGYGGRSGRLKPNKRIVTVFPGLDGENDDLEDKPPKTIGAVKEVNLMTEDVRSDYPFMRHFTGVDHEISEFTNGFYRYDVEIEIEDPTVNFLENKLSELADLTTTLEKYYNVASSQNISSPETITDAVSRAGFHQAGRRRHKLNYSLAAQSFIPEFLDDILQLFSEGTISEDTLLFNLAKESLNKPDQKNSVTQSMAVKYFSIFELLTRRYSGGGLAGFSQAVTLINDIAKIIDPVFGSPEGIGAFLRLVSDLSISLERMLNAKISGPVTKEEPDSDFAGGSPQSLKIDATRTFKVIKEFSNFEDVFDSDIPKNFGMDYLASDQPISDFELMRLNTGDFRERSNLELRKYFGQESILRLDKDYQGGVNLLLAPQRFTYFSPMSVITRRGATYDLLSHALKQSNRFYEPDRYNQILVDALRYNDGLSVDVDPYPIGKNLISEAKAMQRLRGGLIDFMADKSCTVSSMESFNVHVENDKIEDLCGKQSVVFSDVIKFTPILDALSYITPIAGHNNKLSPQGVYTNDLTNPNNVLFKLASYYSHPTYKFSPYTHFNIRHSRQVVFDLDASGDLEDLPNQYKAMIAVSTQRKMPKENHGLVIDLDRDVFQKTSLANDDYLKQDSLGFFYLNFMNLCSAEMLTGYRIVDGSEKNEAQMNEPFFERIETEQWERINNFPTDDRDNRILCRLKRHSSPKINIPEIKGFEFPIYNKHFLMQIGPPQKEIAALLALGPAPQTPAGGSLIAAAANAAARSAIASVLPTAAGNVQAALMADQLVGGLSAAAATPVGFTSPGLSPGTMPFGFLPSTAQIVPALNPAVQMIGGIISPSPGTTNIPLSARAYTAGQTPLVSSAAMAATAPINTTAISNIKSTTTNMGGPSGPAMPGGENY